MIQQQEMYQHCSLYQQREIHTSSIELLEYNKVFSFIPNRKYNPKLLNPKNISINIRNEISNHYYNYLILKRKA